MRRLPALVGLAIGLVLVGCANKPVSYLTLLENPDGTTGKVHIRGNKGEQLVDKAMHGAPLDGSQPAAPVDPVTFQQDFGDAISARPLPPVLFHLYFESGGGQLTPQSEALLPQIKSLIASRPGVDLSIIGHTDTVGNPQDNEKLGLLRAQLVSKLLKIQELAPDAMHVESHGETNPLIPTPDETPEPRNRRVDVSVR
ncbi:MAG: hypothetical protein Fur007_07220 [Rhodoferax sp.]